MSGVITKYALGVGPDRENRENPRWQAGWVCRGSDYDDNRVSFGGPIPIFFETKQQAKGFVKRMTASDWSVRKIFAEAIKDLRLVEVDLVTVSETPLDSEGRYLKDPAS